MKILIILSSLLFIVSCGDPQRMENMDKDVIADFSFNLRYKEFYSESENMNKFSLTYGRMLLEYNKENSVLIEQGNDDALVQINNSGEPSYEYLKKELKININFSEIDEYLVDSIFFDNSIYVSTQKAFYRIGINGSQRLYTINGYQGNFAVLGDELVFATIVEDSVQFVYFTGRSFREQFSLLTSVRDLKSFGTVFYGIGMREDFSEVGFLNDGQTIFEIIDSNNASLIKDGFSFNGSTFLTKDINDDIFKFRGNDAYASMEAKEVGEVNDLFYNLFYAREDHSGIVHLYEIDNGGDVDILIEDVIDSYDNKVFFVNNKYYFLIKSNLDNDVKLISYDLQGNSYSVIKNYLLDYFLYQENNSLYLKRELDGYTKLYSLDEVFIRNLNKL